MGVSNYGLLEITSSNPSQRWQQNILKQPLGCFVKQLLIFDRAKGGDKLLKNNLSSFSKDRSTLCTKQNLKGEGGVECLQPTR
jgi:hypothetical protein